MPVDLDLLLRNVFHFDWLRDACFERLYGEVTKRTARHNVHFLNYGWLPPTPAGLVEPRPTSDPRSQASLSLYQRLLDGAELEGRDALEVSCGHGGGLCFISQHLKPRSLLGIDRNRRAIRFCSERYAGAGISFRYADARSLPCAAASQDVVINVEASHGYANAAAFFREVERVLRPGGHFLLADFRFAGDCERFERELLAGGLELVFREDLTDGVVRALDATTDHTREQIRRLAPACMRRSIGEFAGVQGSRIYRGFKTHGIVYLRYTLRKPGKGERGGATSAS
jgi:ubiquinone/menaquinone biosynthesis C-methylase UbiE